MYTGTVSIPTRGLTWQVEIATTYSELAQGLGGRAFLAPQSGMLFDMGSNQEQIIIDMSEMLFPLDIIFLDNDLAVQTVLWTQEPGDDYNATFPYGPGARYFLEMNAGELDDVAIGDLAMVTGWTPPAPPAPPMDTSSIFGLMVTLMIVTMMMKMMSKMVKGIGEPGEKKFLPVKASSSALEHHSIHGPERQELVDRYGTWAVGRAESMCPENDVECVRRESVKLLQAYKRG